MEILRERTDIEGNTRRLVLWPSGWVECHILVKDKTYIKGGSYQFAPALGYFYWG